MSSSRALSVLHASVLTAVLALPALSGCGLERQVEHYPDMTELAITQGNHPHGFRRLDCFSCHTEANIHRDDRSLGIGLADTARERVQADGLNSCVDCHDGPSGFFNGVEVQ